MAQFYILFFKVILRQYRIILVRGLRSQIFRQNVQIISVHTDVWILIFGQSDGIICKQGVHHELCGVAFISKHFRAAVVRICAGLSARIKKRDFYIISIFGLP